MGEKLDFGTCDREDPRRKWYPGEAPSFDLGLDWTHPSQEDNCKVESAGGLPEITSSNEDQYYGPAEEYVKLAQQLGDAYFPQDSSNSIPPTIAEKTDRKSSCRERVSSYV